MTTPTENIKEIIQYLKSLGLPEDEITYPPELASIIVERAVKHLCGLIEEGEEGAECLENDLENTISNLRDEIEGYKDTLLEIQEIITSND